MKNIADLREHLFAQLEALADPSRKVDLRRMRLTHDIAERIIDTAGVEFQFAAVMKGAMDVPFIEEQTEARSARGAPVGDSETCGSAWRRPRGRAPVAGFSAPHEDVADPRRRLERGALTAPLGVQSRNGLSRTASQ